MWRHETTNIAFFCCVFAAIRWFAMLATNFGLIIRCGARYSRYTYVYIYSDIARVD